MQCSDIIIKLQVYSLHYNNFDKKSTEEKKEELNYLYDY